jgi:hypothetical protein
MSNARRIGLAALLVVMAAAGWYVFVYLYRWEWNRALVSGLIFLAAEMGLFAALILDRLARLGRRVDDIDRARVDERALRRLREHAPEPARPFAWLDRSQMNVFVPVLLGAGVILSAAAFVVERIAGMVVAPRAVPARRRPPVDLELPPDGLLGAETAQPAPDPGVVRRGQGMGRRLVAIAVLGLLVAAAVDLVADATQSRPSPRVAGASTVVELVVDQRRPRPPIEAAEALAVACHGTLHADSEFTEIAILRGDRVRLTVTPSLNETRRRRLFGCLQDATLDLVQAHVVSWTTTPAETAASDAPAGDAS